MRRPRPLDWGSNHQAVHASPAGKKLAEAIAKSECKPWDAAFARLKTADAAGQFLPLLATRTETGKRALVRSGEDFDGIVGEHESAGE